MLKTWFIYSRNLSDGMEEEQKEEVEEKEEEGRKEGRNRRTTGTMERKGRSSPRSRRSLFVDIGRKGKANE